MSVYMIVEAKEIRDKEKYGRYIRAVPETINKFGGKYLARGGKVIVVSGDWYPARLIIVEFESIEKFQAWLGSPEYKAISELREESAITNSVVIEGV